MKCPCWQKIGNIQGWMFDHDGKLRIATAIVDGVNQSILYRENEEDEFKTIITTNFKEGFNPQFFTFDNKNIIGSSNLGRDKYAIVEFDPVTAQEVRVLYANDDYDVNGVGYSRKRKVITAALKAGKVKDIILILHPKKYLTKFKSSLRDMK